MSNRQDRPLAKKLLHALGLLALALFLLYVAVQFVLIFHRSYKTETAIRYTLAESLNLTGVVALTLWMCRAAAISAILCRMASA